MDCIASQMNLAALLQNHDSIAGAAPYYRIGKLAKSLPPLLAGAFPTTKPTAPTVN
jgi:hypothetical protein